MDQVKTLLTGTSGIAVAEVAQPMLQSADVSSIVQVIVQIVIGIATLVGMFKKKSK
jgi:hypothetical protein